jgi:hypothetical protein
VNQDGTAFCANKAVRKELGDQAVQNDAIVTQKGAHAIRWMALVNVHWAIPAKNAIRNVRWALGASIAPKNVDNARMKAFAHHCMFFLK